MNALLHVIPTAMDLLSIMLCIGLLASLVWVTPDVASAGKLHDTLWRLLGPALTALTLISLIGLLQRTAEMGGLAWDGILSSLPLVLLQTHYGMTWFVRAAAIIVLWLLWWPGQRYGSRRIACAMLLLTACVVWSVAASGHGGDWGDFTLSEWMWWLHIMSASLWVGAILAFVLGIQRQLRDPSKRALFAVCAGRLSSLAGMALALVLATGAYNAWHQLGHVSELWSSHYGRIILFKLMLVGLMSMLGAFNRYFNLPLLCRDENRSLSGQQPAQLSPLGILQRFRPLWQLRGVPIRRFTRSVILEVWLALGVLICAALLGHTMPPRKSNVLPSQETSIEQPGMSLPDLHQSFSCSVSSIWLTHQSSA